MRSIRKAFCDPDWLISAALAGAEHGWRL